MIKNIIFDLGVVLYDLDQQATHLALAELGIKNVANIFTIQHQNNLCDQFETGKISESEFFNGLNKLANTDASEKQLKTAWQAMLIGLPQYKFLLLNELQKNYTTMVLSNTNSAHIEKVNTALQESYHLSSINDLFDRTYLSFEVGLRKPELAIFNYVIKHSEINPSETLFIDDLDKNVEAAKHVGIDALLYKQGDDLKALLNKKLGLAET